MPSEKLYEESVMSWVVLFLSMLTELDAYTFTAAKQMSVLVLNVELHCTHMRQRNFTNVLIHEWKLIQYYMF